MQTPWIIITKPSTNWVTTAAGGTFPKSTSSICPTCPLFLFTLLKQLFNPLKKLLFYSQPVFSCLSRSADLHTSSRTWTKSGQKGKALRDGRSVESDGPSDLIHSFSVFWRAQDSQVPDNTSHTINLHTSVGTDSLHCCFSKNGKCNSSLV